MNEEVRTLVNMYGLHDEFISLLISDTYSVHFMDRLAEYLLFIRAGVVLPMPEVDKWE